MSDLTHFRPQMTHEARAGRFKKSRAFTATDFDQRTVNDEKKEGRVNVYFISQLN